MGVPGFFLWLWKKYKSKKNNETVFEKIHGPVGLAIGSESPEEVSLSIMAEIISIFKSSIINQ